MFVVKRGQIATPPITAGALRGITRSVVFDIAAELGIKISEPELTRHDLYIADEAFLTGTAAEVIPVIKVDGRTIGNGKPGEITNRTIARFRELTRESGTPIFRSDRTRVGRESKRHASCQLNLLPLCGLIDQTCCATFVNAMMRRFF